MAKKTHTVEPRVLKYFYKSKDSKGWLADYVAHPELLESGYVEITKAEWDAHMASIAPKAPTAKQLAKQEKKREIASLKSELAKSDYKAIKFAEGWITAEEYAPIKAERQALRDRINKLEGEL